MRLAFLALALTLPATASALPAEPPPGSAARHRLASGPTPSRICRDDLRVRPIRSPGGAKPKRLGELPPGDLTLTVLNRVGDCIEPAIVGQGYGLGGR
jgi:hypothetical protein